MGTMLVQLLLVSAVVMGTVVAAFLRVGFYLVDEGQRLTRKRLVDDAHDRQPPLVQ